MGLESKVKPHDEGGEELGSGDMNQVVKNKDREESRAKVKPHDEGGEELGSGDMNQVVKKMTNIKDTKIRFASCCRIILTKME